MDFKDRMIDAIERGYTTEQDAYEYVRESLADRADLARKQERENDLRSETGGGDEEGSGSTT